tara:strand:- start:432 stop:671 length:240 start_codon:yes stop_codon:yes gene_type:complete
LISLDSDSVNEMRFEVDWELINKLEELVKSVCDDHVTKKEIEALLEKRYNLIAAQILIEDLEDLEILHGIEKDLEVSKQ